MTIRLSRSLKPALSMHQIRGTAERRLAAEIAGMVIRGSPANVVPMRTSPDGGRASHLEEGESWKRAP